MQCGPSKRQIDVHFFDLFDPLFSVSVFPPFARGELFFHQKNFGVFLCNYEIEAARACTFLKAAGLHLEQKAPHFVSFRPNLYQKRQKEEKLVESNPRFDQQILKGSFRVPWFDCCLWRCLRSVLFSSVLPFLETLNKTRITFALYNLPPRHAKFLPISFPEQFCPFSAVERPTDVKISF